MSTGDSINGIRRVDLQTRGPWRRRLSWWMGGALAASQPALAVLRKVAMPFEPTVMKATRGRLTLSPTLPVVVLTSVGARSGERREVPLAYFTDGDDVILIASNYGGSRHPARPRLRSRSVSCRPTTSPGRIPVSVISRTIASSRRSRRLLPEQALISALSSSSVSASVTLASSLGGLRPSRGSASS